MGLSLKIKKGDYMDDSLSWRAKLAKSNINILDVDEGKVTIEFTYHPRPNIFKWCKTYFTVPANVQLEDGSLGEYIQAEVLNLRKELEW